MATVLGDAKIRVILDTSDAKKTMDEVKKRSEEEARRIEGLQQKIGGIKKTPSGTLKQPAGSPGLQTAAPFTGGPGAPPQAAGNTVANAIRQVAQAAQVVNQAGAGGNAMPANPYSYGQSAVGDSAFGALSKVGAGIAIGYTAASTVAQNLPTVVELVKAALPEAIRNSETVNNIMTTTEQIRAAMIEVEAKFQGYIQAFSQTGDFVAAGAQITGQLSDYKSITRMYDAYAQVNAAQNMLDAKMKFERRDEIAQGLQSLFNNSTKRSQGN